MKKFVTISSVKTKTLALVEKYKNELKDIECVVGMSRGGFIPAALVAMKLDKPLLAIYIKKDKTYYFPSMDLIDSKKILFVDDVCRTGKTMFGAVMWLKGFTKGDNIQVMTVFDIRSIEKTSHPQMTNSLLEDIQLPWDYE